MKWNTTYLDAMGVDELKNHLTIKNSIMKKADLIGKKVKGFKFESGKYGSLAFHPDMHSYIGKEGVITEYYKPNKSYTVQFKKDEWQYPASLIEKLLIKKQPVITKTKTMKNSGKIEIRKSRAVQPFRVRYIGKNGEILATSENLSNRKDAIKNIRAMGKVFGIGKPGSVFFPVDLWDYSKGKEPVISKMHL